MASSCMMVGLWAAFIMWGCLLVVCGRKTRLLKDCTAACAPMSKIVVVDDTGDSKETITDAMDEFATNFTASVHADHFRMIFNDYYNIDISTWSKASIADNAMANNIESPTCWLLESHIEPRYQRLG